MLTKKFGTRRPPGVGGYEQLTTDHRPLPLSYHCLMVLRLNTALVKLFVKRKPRHQRTNRYSSWTVCNTIFWWIRTTYIQPTDRTIDHNLFHTTLCSTFGKTSIQKKRFFGPCPNHLTPPPLTPIWATWSFFSDVKIQDLKVTLQKCGEGREIC